MMQFEVHQWFRTKFRKGIFLLLILVCGFHGMLHLNYGFNSCKWLMSDGRFVGNIIWQPYGCMMHTYNRIDSRMCLRYIAYWGGRNSIVFLGDSRIRQLYYALVNLISTHPIEEPKLHQNMSFKQSDLNLEVEFIWNPMIDADMFNVYHNWLAMSGSDRPKIVVTGSATHAIKTSNASLTTLEQYRQNLTRLLPLMEEIGETSQILWVLQDPVVAERLSTDRVMITNEQIDLYNKAALEILKYTSSSGVHIWSSSRLVAQGYNNDQKDGLHAGPVALNWDIQILLNMYCNDQMNYNDGTCCSDPEPITTIQIITFVIIGVCITLSAGIWIRSRMTSRKYQWQLLVSEEDEEAHEMVEQNTDNDNDQEQNQDDVQISTPKPLSRAARTVEDTKSVSELVTLLGRLGLIMIYVFIADRTNFFMKENKYYTHSNFFLPIAYVFALGLFFTEESRHTVVLHRDQTDEWKGWMQLVLLAYHMTGASQNLPIYVHIRLLVTAYLFLSGFGHFTYFWYSNDIGFHRFWQVMFRVNLSVICLCLVMNRPYQFYYFVPLVSFWFLCLFFAMSVIPRVTSASADANPMHYFYMVLKLVGLFSIVTILYMSEVFFEKIFQTRPWKALFVTTDDSIKEWWFRWKIDRYSVPAGMVFALGLHLLKTYQLIDDRNHGNLLSRGWALLATFLSIVAIGIYVAFAFLCRNKPECNEIHPYISFIPILGYITLRNISGLLRNRFSAFFSWFGKISLELFIFQYHIWLAADTHGVLVLIPSYPVLNVIVTSLIFICVAHEFHEITQRLIRYAIPNDWRFMARNLLVFLLVLIPIGIKDGMF